MKINIVNYLNQDFNSLKIKHYTSARLFIDDLFPPDNTSISLNAQEANQYSKIFWKRPHEICKEPKFIINDIETNGFSQGEIGNCWFISAAISLVSQLESNLIKFVIPTNQSFDPNDYAGIFHFRFWQFGLWFDVCVDDYLPVNLNNELVYCASLKNKNEFYGPLLEKAYAKLARCYRYLDYGDPKVAMSDLTSAVCESIDISKLSIDDKKGKLLSDGQDDFDYLELLWLYIRQSLNTRSLLNVSFNSKSEISLINKLMGLQSDHTYSILQAVEFDMPESDNKTRLLKIRNPFVNRSLNQNNNINSNLSSLFHSDDNWDWIGDWSKNSDKWKGLSESIKRQHDLRLESRKGMRACPGGTGEFYISFEDFIKSFEEMDVAHLNLNSYFDYLTLASSYYLSSTSSRETRWIYRSFYDLWLIGVNAGHTESAYWSNNQYLIKINDSRTLSSQVIVSLMQPYSWESRHERNGNYKGSFIGIKFDIFYVLVDRYQVNDHLRKKRRFNKNDLIICDSSADYYNEQKEISKKCYLHKGFYVIIASNANQFKNVNYLIRIFHPLDCAQILGELIFKEI